MKNYNIGFYTMDDHNYPVYEENNSNVPYKVGEYISLDGEKKSTHLITSITHNLKKSTVLILIKKLK